jgi:hypothetical protein
MTGKEIVRAVFVLMLFFGIPILSEGPGMNASAICLFALVFIVLIGIWCVLNRLDNILSELKTFNARKTELQAPAN